MSEQMTATQPSSLPTVTTGDDESRRHRRLLLYIVSVSLFWCVILYLAHGHENLLVYILLSAFALTILSLLGSICWLVVTTPGFLTSRPQLHHQQQYELTDRTGLTTTCNEDRRYHHHDDNNDWSMPTRFEDTARCIRSCQEVIAQDRPPNDGTYNVVYAAVVFGKQVRSEGIMHLEFTPSDGRNRIHHQEDKTVRPTTSSTTTTVHNGWEISGTSNFGSTSTTILEGFVNAEGQAYWIVPFSDVAVRGTETRKQAGTSLAVLHRGILNFERCILDDGEFQSISLQSAASRTDDVDKKHEGRIVRMEFVGATNHCPDVNEECTPEIV